MGAGEGVPYGPVISAVRHRLERERAPDDLLEDVWLSELGRLLPEIRERYPDLAPPTADEVTARSRLFEAVVRLVEALYRPEGLPASGWRRTVALLGVPAVPFFGTFRGTGRWTGGPR